MASAVTYDSPLAARLHPWKRPGPAPLRIENVNVVDTLEGTVLSSKTVVISGGLVTSVEDSARDIPAVSEETGIHIIDGSGLYLCPGLIDCHCHLNLPPAGPSLASVLALSDDQRILRQPPLCRDVLYRGFTTVRDPAGSSLALKQAIEDGLFPGPRVFFAGMALSQTGGHGDIRGPHVDGQASLCCGGPQFGKIMRVVDGVPQCLRAAREELQRGADFLKIMAGGGVASPTDKLEAPQFIAAEIEAITTVARNFGTYVTAHAYSPEAITLAINNGVTCVEHGNLIDGATAKLMADSGVFLSSTLITYHQMGDTEKWPAFLPPESAEKNKAVLKAGFDSLRLAKEAGVTICYGTDLIGPMQIAQAKGLSLMAEVLSPVEVMQTATVNPAKLLRQEKFLGQLRPGFAGDALLLKGNPLQNIALLEEKDNILAVIKAGRLELDRLNELQLV